MGRDGCGGARRIRSRRKVDRIEQLSFSDFGTAGFNRIDFRSTQAAFEFALAPAQVPEPGTLALLGLGLASLGLLGRRRRTG